MKIIPDVSATLLRAEQTSEFYSSTKLRLIAIYPTHKKGQEIIYNA